MKLFSDGSSTMWMWAHEDSATSLLSWTHQQLAKEERPWPMSEQGASVERDVAKAFAAGTWVATRGQCNGIEGTWWNIQVPRGNAEYTWMQDLAMAFDVEGNVEANATVMAAAPDMLAALQHTLDYWKSTGFAECEPDCDCIVDLVRAAIAKAEGRSAS